MEDTNVTVDDMRAAFGLAVENEGDANDDPNLSDNPTPEPDPEPNGSEEDNGTPPSNDDGDGGQDGQGDDQQPQQQQQQSQQQQQLNNQAFARMRVENANLQKSLNTIANVLGINTYGMSSEQLAAVIQDQGLTALARQQGVSPEIYKRLDQLEGINARYMQQQSQARAQKAFMDIQEKYGATGEDLQGFVGELVREGYNMDAPGADLEQEFIRRNFDKIMQMRVDAAVQAEQQRASKGQAASQPNKTKGQKSNNDNAKEINSVSELEDLFRNM